MFIFNLWALLVALVIILVSLGFYSVAPQFMEGVTGNFIVGVLTFLIGGVTEFVGIKGRIFFFPIWLLGLAIMGFQLYEWFGGWGIAGGCGLFVIAVVALLKLAKWTEARKWERLQGNGFFEEAKFAATPEAYWKAVKKYFFLPASIDYSTAIYVHNWGILSNILSRSGLGLSASEIETIQGFQMTLGELETAQKQESPKMDAIKLITQLITQKANASG